MPDSNEWTPTQIRELRRARRETQQQFADVLVRGRTTIAAWETGAKKPDAHSLRNLDSIAEAAHA